MLSFASGPSQPEQFLLIYSSLGYGTGVPTPRIAADFAFPFFDSSLCVGFLPHAYNQSFVQQIQIRRFTTLHFLCWLRHQRAFRAVSAFCYYYAARLSELFGSLLIRAFRQSVDPSFSAVRWSELFGSPLVRAFRQSVDPSFSAVR